jgi:hypothetical protein
VIPRAAVASDGWGMHEQPRPDAPDAGAETPPRAETDAEPQVGDAVTEVDPDVAQLLGLRPPDSPSMPTADEVDTLGEITDTRIYQGDLEARPAGSDQPDEDPAANIEMLEAQELRDGETDDPNEAAEEGLTWIPPVDPPVRVGDDGQIEVAAGFGTTASDEPFDPDHRAEALSPHDEVEARVLEALRANAATSSLVDRLALDAEGGQVVISGEVDDLTDEDAVLAVAEDVAGVVTAVSRMRIASLSDQERQARA